MRVTEKELYKINYLWCKNTLINYFYFAIVYVITEWYDARLTVGRLVRTAGKIINKFKVPAYKPLAIWKDR